MEDPKATMGIRDELEVEVGTTADTQDKMQPRIRKTGRRRQVGNRESFVSP